MLANEGWVEIDIVHIASPGGAIKPISIFIFEKILAVDEYSIPSEGVFGIRLLKK